MNIIKSAFYIGQLIAVAFIALVIVMHFVRAIVLGSGILTIALFVVALAIVWHFLVVPSYREYRDNKND